MRENQLYYRKGQLLSVLCNVKRMQCVHNLYRYTLKYMYCTCTRMYSYIFTRVPWFFLLKNCFNVSTCNTYSLAETSKVTFVISGQLPALMTLRTINNGQLLVLIHKTNDGSQRITFRANFDSFNEPCQRKLLFESNYPGSVGWSHWTTRADNSSGTFCRYKVKINVENVTLDENPYHRLWILFLWIFASTATNKVNENMSEEKLTCHFKESSKINILDTVVCKILRFTISD